MHRCLLFGFQKHPAELADFGRIMLGRLKLPTRAVGHPGGNKGSSRFQTPNVVSRPRRRVKRRPSQEVAHTPPTSATSRQSVGLLRGARLPERASGRCEMAQCSARCRLLLLPAPRIRTATRGALHGLTPACSVRLAGRRAHPFPSRKGLEQPILAMDDAAHVALSFAHCLSRRPAH